MSPRLRALAVVAVALGPLAAAGCGAGEPATPRTTTVTVTPTQKPAPSPTATTSATTSATSTPPTTYDQALQHFAAGKVDAGAKSAFTSPTGNIFCSIAQDGDTPAGCELRDGRIAPPPGTCDTGGGGGAKDVGRIEWKDGVPRPICNSDTMVKLGVPVLPYTVIATADGSPYRCISETIGMTCVDTETKKGFFLAKGAYKTF